MDYVETEGDTIDQAIENALIRLGVERDRISIEILSEGKRGILGFGAQKARVRASLRRPAVEANHLEPAAGSRDGRKRSCQAFNRGGNRRYWRKGQRRAE